MDIGKKKTLKKSRKTDEVRDNVQNENIVENNQRKYLYSH